MWAQVKFEYDEQVILTPLSNFKDQQKVEEELKFMNIRPNYDVFWSPDPDDTPEKLLKKENRILHRDILRAQVKDKLCKKSQHKPEAGWYKASIKQWEASLEKLEKLLDDPSGRKRKPGEKMIGEEKKRKIAEKRQDKILKEIARKKSTVPSINVNISSSVNGDEHSSSLSKDHSKKGKGDSSSTKDRSKKVQRDLSSSDESIEDDKDGVTYWEHDAVCKELREIKAELKKYKNLAKDAELVPSLQKEVKSLREQVRRLVDHNLYWQDQIRSMSKSSSKDKRQNLESIQPSPKDKPSSKKSLLSIYSCSVESNKDTEMGSQETRDAAELSKTESEPLRVMHQSTPVQTPVLEEQETELVEESTDVLAVSLPDSEHLPALDPPTQPAPGPAAPASTQPAPDHAVQALMPPAINAAAVISNKQKKASKSASLGGIQLQASDFKLTAPDNVFSIGFEQFMKIAGSVQAGEAGDSQFYKNCAACLWPDDRVLAERSVTGAACPNDQSKLQKKECTPAKKQYLKELLQVRISHERFPVDDAAIQRRLSSTALNNYLRQKIKTVARNLKLRNQP